jgi:serine-type D-Ala-D-Ala carboxypeptidase
MGANADELARRITAEGVAPDCAAGCAIRSHGVWRREVGGAVTLLFDLASLTKPMTAVAVAEAGHVIDRRAPLGALLPEAHGTASEGIALELLLAHRAGLEGHRPLYEPLLRGETVDLASALHEAADARRADASGDPPPEGFDPVYSDLGYILAGEALARARGARDAGEAIASSVLEPLGILEQAGTVRDLAARGVVGPFAPTETVPWRGGPIIGAVHDENAWALTGVGGSGHAGIFATIDAVLTFGAATLDWLDRVVSGHAGDAGHRGQTGHARQASHGRDIDRASRDLAWLVRSRPGGDLRAGFDGKSGHTSDGSSGSSGGSRLGPRSFGHLGFTGTSLWIDPDAKVVLALLTNRVCPTRTNLAIRAARPWAHDTLFDRAIFLGRA